MTKIIDKIQNLINQKAGDKISQLIKESAEGKSKEEKHELAKEIAMKLMLPKLLKANVKELIEIDFARYFDSKEINGIDAVDLIEDLVRSGYEAGLTECKDCRTEDGNMDADMVIPVVQRLYSDVVIKYPNLKDVEPGTQEQLQTAILFSMRAAIQNITTGEYLDLMMGEDFPDWKKEACLTEEAIKGIYK